MVNIRPRRGIDILKSEKLGIIRMYNNLKLLVFFSFFFYLHRIESAVLLKPTHHHKYVIVNIPPTMSQ